MARNYYDITIARDTLGEGYQADDLIAYCEAAEDELADVLQADVRVRFGDGTEGYTFIGADQYTCQGPLTEAMRDALAAVYEHGERWVCEATPDDDTPTEALHRAEYEAHASHDDRLANPDCPVCHPGR